MWALSKETSVSRWIHPGVRFPAELLESAGIDALVSPMFIGSLIWLVEHLFGESGESGQKVERDR